MARLERNQNLYVGENKIVQNLQLLLLSPKETAFISYPGKDTMETF